MRRADLLFHSKRSYDDGAIAELRIWLLPESVPGSEHRLKYSLFYGKPGQRILGFDNERGKGDHRHDQGREAPYDFVSVEQLVADFESGVARLRGETE